MGKSAPKPPDPYKTAAAQSRMNRDTAITQQELNMVNQQGPWGSVQYAQTGTSANGTPIYTQSTTLSPEQQALFDATSGAQRSLAELAQQQAGTLRSVIQDPFEFTNRDAETWAYDLAAPRILQQQGQNEAALRATLANKGIREGSAAWDAEMARMTNANTDQLNQLALTGRGQAFNEALASRGQSINELGALLGFSGITPPSQAYGQTPQTGVASTDLSGLVQQNYQQQLANYQNQMGGLFGLGSSLLDAAGKAGGFGSLFTLSDRRLKKDIKRVGETDAGVPIYTYRYVWGGPVRMGVMAQDVPEAAVETDSGFLVVDYGRVV